MSLYNIIVCKLFGSVVLSELLAFVSLVALVGVGCYIMWTEKKGLCYGVGVGMAWYLVSRVIEYNTHDSFFVLSHDSPSLTHKTTITTTTITLFHVHDQHLLHTYIYA